MNWPRGLFRLWAIASVLWVVGYIAYFWHSCLPETGTGDYWCFTGEFDDWTEPLRYFGWRQYSYNAGWTFGVPIAGLLIGSAIYAAVHWVLLGFRGKDSN